MYILEDELPIVMVPVCRGKSISSEVEILELTVFGMVIELPENTLLPVKVVDDPLRTTFGCNALLSMELDGKDILLVTSSFCELILLVLRFGILI